MSKLSKIISFSVALTISVTPPLAIADTTISTLVEHKSWELDPFEIKALEKSVFSSWPLPDQNQMERYFTGWGQVGAVHLTVDRKENEISEIPGYSEFYWFSSELILSLRLAANGYQEIAEHYFAGAVFHIFVSKRKFLGLFPTIQRKEQIEVALKTYAIFTHNYFLTLPPSDRQKIQDFLQFYKTNEGRKSLRAKVSTNASSGNSLSEYEKSLVAFGTLGTFIATFLMSQDASGSSSSESVTSSLLDIAWSTINAGAIGFGSLTLISNYIPRRHGRKAVDLAEQYLSECEKWLTEGGFQP